MDFVIHKYFYLLGRFTDLTEGCLDTEAEELRERLRMEKLPAKLPSSQLYRYNISWDAIGINLYNNEEHIRYVMLTLM